MISLFSHMGLCLSMEDLSSAMLNIESDFPSFLTKLAPKLKESSFVETELRSAFGIFDTEASGSVSVRQMKKAIDRFVRPQNPTQHEKNEKIEGEAKEEKSNGKSNDTGCVKKRS